MACAFPYAFEPEESGGLLVQFVDVPEAHTFGATEADAGGDRALDCLIAAPGGYVKLGRKVPRPSPARGRPVATLPPLVAAKLARYEAMRAQGITRTALARRLGLQENAVRRLLDLDRRSRIHQIDRVVAALGKRSRSASCSRPDPSPICRPRIRECNAEQVHRIRTINEAFLLEVASPARARTACRR